MIIKALENVPFEEWEAYVRYAMLHHREEAVSLLEMVAKVHYDSGWRFNAICLLQEADLLRREVRDELEQGEVDPQTLLLLRGEL